MTTDSPAEPPTDDDAVRAETVLRLERAMGALGTAAVARMEERLSWFRSMSAEDRSWVGLVAQSGVAAFVDWFKNPNRGRPAIAVEVFGTAPRELTRSVSLQQTVEMVRVVIGRPRRCSSGRATGRPRRGRGRGRRAGQRRGRASRR